MCTWSIKISPYTPINNFCTGCCYSNLFVYPHVNVDAQWCLHCKYESREVGRMHMSRKWLPLSAGGETASCAINAAVKAQRCPRITFGVGWWWWCEWWGRAKR